MFRQLHLDLIERIIDGIPIKPAILSGLFAIGLVMGKHPLAPILLGVTRNDHLSILRAKTFLVVAQGIDDHMPNKWRVHFGVRMAPHFRHDRTDRGLTIVDENH